MSRKERDAALPPIAESAEARLQAAEWNDEDAEDVEEQGLFEQDNVAAIDAIAAEAADEAASETAGGEDEGEDRGSSGPFYVQSSAGDAWELTWPIWHMLPRNERHAIAVQHCMKTIGDFEEYMSLHQAIDESENVDGAAVRRQAAVVLDMGSAGGEARPEEAEVSGDTADVNWHPPYIGRVDEVEDDGEDSSVSTAGDDALELEQSTATDAVDIDLEHHLEMIRLGGLPCSLPDEILHKCFAFLPIDDHANLALVSPHWLRFTRCESLYKTLCQRVYLNQSKRKTLHVGRFDGSYRKMLELRPRVRTGGGLYVLKYQEVRKIERDMWTEIPVGAILESVYFRYLYFFEDGRVMYALTHATPVEMIPRFHKMLVHGYGSKDKWGVWGRYSIQKDVVRVWVSHSWHDVCFQMRVVHSNKALHYDSGDRGLCTTMMLEEHLSSASGNFDENSYDRVKYEIPSHCAFRYLRDRRL